MLKIVWSEEYLKYKFGPNHPFWPERGRVFLDLIDEAGLRYDLAEPEKASDSDVLLVHVQGYLDGVKKLYQEGGSLSPDTPLYSGVLEAAYYSVGGSILAARLALSGEKVINPLGGWHHAKTARGGGFCIFADHAIAIRKLQQESVIEKAMVFDLDAHAGNGTQEIFYSDPAVFNISLHQDPHTLYPGTGFAHQRGQGEGKGFNLNVPLSPGATGSRYLEELDSVLPLRGEYQPDLTFLILGVDTYKEDPLTQLGLEEDDYFKIGKRFNEFRNLAVLFAGGYSKKTPELWLNFIRGLMLK
ncbi:MAG: histone deacetylase family protein [Patescibacteria group bacterium]|nr:histone deacetylase family protein [Patescibacteria group bacterium]